MDDLKPVSEGRSEKQPIGRAFVLTLGFVTLALEGYDLIVFGTTVPALLQYEPWGLEPGQVGLLGSAAVVGMLFGALGAGALADIVGRKLVVAGSVSVFSVAMVACALAPSVELFTLARFVVGIGAGALLPSFITLLIEIAPATRRNLYVSISFTGTLVGGMVAALVGLIFVPGGQFRPVYLVGALPAVILVPLLLRYLPETVKPSAPVRLSGSTPAVDGSAPPENHAAPAITATLGTRVARLFQDGFAVPTLIFWAVTFLSLLTLFGATTWLPSLMTAAGFGVGSALVFLVLLNAGGVVGTIVASSIADRIGAKVVLITACLCASVSFVCLSLQPPTWLVYFFVMLAGFGAFGAQILANSFIGTAYPADRRAIGLGFSLGVGRLGGILGPALGGILIAANLSQHSNFLIFAMPPLLAAVLLVILRTSVRERTESVHVTGVAASTI
ncbi:MAG: aromatic acid/H+ symport family MFS transporter [Rhodococcus sp. (in: high G+C Gram-positive bacteria)]|uniref:MFS transporter n=1 Tax=Rhodococcus sp. TaxID=1831 RepID=UPI002AD8473F|nr:aromatic acid/H+ symport family MFS transporter [Rhodococcus sp. (in: high G+C Gram-positive bacteria)]